MISICVGGSNIKYVRIIVKGKSLGFKQIYRNMFHLSRPSAYILCTLGPKGTLHKLIFQ